MLKTLICILDLKQEKMYTHVHSRGVEVNESYATCECTVEGSVTC